MRALILTSLVLSLSTSLFAEEKKDKPLPKSGSLSTNISGITGNKAVPGPWGGVDTSGEDASPISGSVSKLSKERWVVKLFNNSENTFSVDVAVTQLDRNGSSVKKDNYSYTLMPKQSVERSVTASPQTEQANLELVKWKKIGGDKEEKKKE